MKSGLFFFFVFFQLFLYSFLLSFQTVGHQARKCAFASISLLTSMIPPVLFVLTDFENMFEEAPRHSHSENQCMYASKCSHSQKKFYKHGVFAYQLEHGLSFQKFYNYGTRTKCVCVFLCVRACASVHVSARACVSARVWFINLFVLPNRSDKNRSTKFKLINRQCYFFFPFLILQIR